MVCHRSQAGLPGCSRRLGASSVDLQRLCLSVPHASSHDAIHACFHDGPHKHHDRVFGVRHPRESIPPIGAWAYLRSSFDAWFGIGSSDGHAFGDFFGHADSSTQKGYSVPSVSHIATMPCGGALGLGLAWRSTLTPRTLAWRPHRVTNCAEFARNAPASALSECSGDPGPILPNGLMWATVSTWIPSQSG